MNEVGLWRHLGAVFWPWESVVWGQVCACVCACVFVCVCVSEREREREREREKARGSLLASAVGCDQVGQVHTPCDGVLGAGVLRMA